MVKGGTGRGTRRAGAGRERCDQRQVPSLVPMPPASGGAAQGRQEPCGLPSSPLSGLRDGSRKPPQMGGDHHPHVPLYSSISVED